MPAILQRGRQRAALSRHGKLAFEPMIRHLGYGLDKAASKNALTTRLCGFARRSGGLSHCIIFPYLYI
jgi:hypothetical protein